MLLRSGLAARQLCQQRQAVLGMVTTRSQAARRVTTAAAAAAHEQQQQPEAVRPVQFEGINNFRDLAEAFADMRPGCVFRTAGPVNATPADVKVLYEDLGIKDLMDLRSSEEVAMEGVGCPAFAGTSYCRYRRDRAVDRVVPDASSYVHGDTRSDVMRVQIAVMEKRRYYYSLLSRMSKRKALQLAATALVDKPASQRIAIEEVNRGGLEGLYRVLLEDSTKEFVGALRHVARCAEQGRPLLFFCKAGKDRTGLLAALLLSVLGAGREAVLDDYERSDAFHVVALAGLEENPKVTGLDRAKFERAPREAMAGALDWLYSQPGGVSGYLTRGGFMPEEQEELRTLLLRRPSASPAGSDDASTPARGKL